MTFHDYALAHAEELTRLTCDMTLIPAPSGHERKRAEYCAEWLKNFGAEGVEIDEFCNVVWKAFPGKSGKWIIFSAHTDTVFDFDVPLEIKKEDDKLYCPGIGDDTACVAAMLMCAKYIAENNLQPADCGLLIVVNSCEEGLGNLKGTRKLMEDFGSRVREFVTLDGTTEAGVSRAVGSKRYRVEIDTEGGHSYGAFGNHGASCDDRAFRNNGAAGIYRGTNKTFPADPSHADPAGYDRWRRNGVSGAGQNMDPADPDVDRHRIRRGSGAVAADGAAQTAAVSQDAHRKGQ